MKQVISRFDRAVLIDWSCAVETEDIFKLVQELGGRGRSVGASLVVILSIQPEVSLLRDFFLTHSGGATAAQRVQLCDSRQEAIECALRLAPREVLGLTRTGWRTCRTLGHLSSRVESA